MDQDHLKGYILGSAYGDALGEPVEFFDYEQIVAHYGSQGIQEPKNQAMFTDDTEMMMAVGRGIVRNKKAEIETMMNNVAKEFIKWLEKTGIAPGNTCMSACMNLRKGKSWKESGIVNSKGCGSAMRSGIIGMLFDDKQKIKEIAHNVGIITHGHKDADAAAQAAALLVYYARTGTEIMEYPKLLREDIGGISANLDNLLNKAEELVKNETITDVEALEKLGQGWVGDEAVIMALYTILKYKDDYKKVVTIAVNITGDSDSIGAIAGGIVGARIGYAKLPNEWEKKLVEKERIIDFLTQITRSI